MSFEPNWCMIHNEPRANCPCTGAPHVVTPMDVYGPQYNAYAHRSHVKKDLLSKFAREDWHGVADAAMDLRDIDAFVLGKNGADHP